MSDEEAERRMGQAVRPDEHEDARTLPRLILTWIVFAVGIESRSAE